MIIKIQFVYDDYFQTAQDIKGSNRILDKQFSSHFKHIDSHRDGCSIYDIPMFRNAFQNTPKVVAYRLQRVCKQLKNACKLLLEYTENKPVAFYNFNFSCNPVFAP